MHPSSVSVFDPLPYRARRERIAARVDDGALLLHAGSLRTRSNDTEYRFRPDSDFHYLTGLAEPEAILLLRPGRDPACTLFVLPREPEAERWTGRRVGPEGAAEIYGADAAYPLAALDEQLPRLLDGVVALFTPFTRPPALEGALTRALAHLRRYNRQGKHAPITFHDARHLLGEDRIVKDAAALASLRRAIDASAEGHLSAMRATTPGMFEYELEARVEYEFRRRGSLPGYTTIVGAGANATILHYVENNAPLVAGELVLIDAGAERDNFTGD
ncbi:MAG: aminopeptidase P N-terminal domain-containing protein, partial [Nannocystaceae bacterium]